MIGLTVPCNVSKSLTLTYRMRLEKEVSELQNQILFNILQRLAMSTAS